jgi:hypothetical protein
MPREDTKLYSCRTNANDGQLSWSLTLVGGGFRADEDTLDRHESPGPLRIS